MKASPEGGPEMKVTAEQLWEMQQQIQHDVKPLVKAITEGFDYDPGHSDLDNDQPITVRMTLGDYLLACRLLYELTHEERD